MSRGAPGPVPQRVLPPVSAVCGARLLAPLSSVRAADGLLVLLNPMLVSQLEELMAPLDLVDVDLPASIQLIEDATRLAVPSLLGWILTFLVGDQELSLTSALTGIIPADVTASLRLPLGAISSTESDGHVTFYASRPGAFRDLAADVATGASLPAGAVQLDQDLSTHLVAGLTGLQELSTINRAVGVLVGRGDTLLEARSRLERVALVHQVSVHEAAVRLLRSP